MNSCIRKYCIGVLLLLAVFTAVAQDIDYDNCTSVIVGRAASVDGSTMTSHSCDSGTDRTWINVVPAKKYKAGALCPIYYQAKRTRGPGDDDVMEMGVIPQAAETYAYINTAYPVMNEYQLAIGETTFMGKREMCSDEGILDCPELYRLALERCKTAREAILLIDALTKEFGYNDVGECFTFADPLETWHFEILGPGSGKIGAVWAAIRVPDGHVGVSANASRIRRIDLSDTQNVMASDNVFSLAEEMGFWRSDSGEPFEFCYAYADRRSMGCRRREWRVLSTVAPSLKLDPNGENFPFSVKPEKKLSIQDVLALFRDAYENTPFDMTSSLMTVTDEGETVKSPVATPFMNNELRTLLKVPRERTIACSRATYVQVTQSRSWLPDAIGGVVWLGYDNPVTTPHMPFYCGISRMPAAFEIDGRRAFRRDCAWWAFRRVSQLALFRWQQMTVDIDAVCKPMEEGYFARQDSIESEAVKLYKNNPGKAGKFLTDYCIQQAETATARYWELGDALWSQWTNRF